LIFRLIFSTFLLAACLLRAVGANAEASASEKALAARLFDDASKLMAAGQAPAACAKFAESQRLDPELGTLLHLGECYAKIGKTASAWTTFKEAADVAAQRGDPRSARIRDRVTGIEQSLSELVLVVSESEPQTLEIRQDGVLLGRAGWGSAVPVDPGEHTITASAPGLKPRELKVTVLGGGQTVTIRLPAAEAAPPAATQAAGAPKLTPSAPSQLVPSPAATHAASSKQRKRVALLVGGAGVVGLGLGATFGLMVKPTYDKSSSHCNGNFCDSAGHDDRQSAFSKALVSDIAFGVGAAALAASAVIWLTATKSNADEAAPLTLRPSLGLHQASLAAERSW